MYNWCDATHCHLGGQCPHECKYCFVDNPRFGRPEKYKGCIRLLENEFNVKYGSGKTIFIEHCNDMLAEGVSDFMIQKILDHCFAYPDNTYVFQTKNPARYSKFKFPEKSILGTTIESDIYHVGISKAPTPHERYQAMKTVRGRKFVTIEPILDCNPYILAGWLKEINPEFITLGLILRGMDYPSQVKIRLWP
jgi:DNA repair photolyase